MNDNIHHNTQIKTKWIGENSRIGAFTCIQSSVRIGSGCLIGSHVNIEDDVLIGNNVEIGDGAILRDNIVIEDNVIIGPNVTIAHHNLNIKDQGITEMHQTIIKDGVLVGANATILKGVKLGLRSHIMPGTVITNDLPAGAIAAGNPARITGYVSASTYYPNQGKDHLLSEKSNYKVAKLIELPTITDLRGSLTFGEYSKHLPFDPKRYFIVYDVPSEDIRGEHAHKKLHQFLVCLSGSCSVVVNDGLSREEILLNRPNLGLYVPPMVWATQYKFSREAILLVLASEKYEAEDYIRDYDQYLFELNK
jgi:acetyltransferase-like isoleucine patch superfamily enzyme